MYKQLQSTQIKMSSIISVTWLFVHYLAIFFQSNFTPRYICVVQQPIPQYPHCQQASVRALRNPIHYVAPVVHVPGFWSTASAPESWNSRDTPRQLRWLLGVWVRQDQDFKSPHSPQIHTYTHVHTHTHTLIMKGSCVRAKGTILFITLFPLHLIIVADNAITGHTRFEWHHSH